MKLFLSATSLLFAGLSCAQDSTALIKDAENLLKTKAVSVSGILSDKKYIGVHPATAFRDLVKQYATTDVLTINTPDEPGKKIVVKATVKNKEGKPVPNALVYLYQTDSKGWYAADAPHVTGNEGDTRHARLFGYVKTNANGNFEMHTVKPSGYPQSDLPAHIHIHIWANGYNTSVTELLFDDDERLKGSIRENSIRYNFLIAKPEKATAPFEQQFSYTLTIQ
jgi:protocatechuate 3,4-dioxygenase beta subunit